MYEPPCGLFWSCVYQFGTIGIGGACALDAGLSEAADGLLA